MASAFAEERAFGRSVGIVLVALAGIQAWRGRPTAGVWMAAIGLVLVACGLASPRLLVVPNRLWRGLAHVLGWINTRVLLTAFYFLVLTPVGVVMRSIGRDPLARRGRGSSWTPYGARIQDPRHFDRQF